MSDNEDHAETLAANPEEPTPALKNEPATAPKPRGGKGKQKLVDDNATLLSLAMQASGVQQEEVDHKLEKTRAKDAKTRESTALSYGKRNRSNVKRKSNRLVAMKAQLKSDKSQSGTSKKKADTKAKSGPSSNKKRVAFQ